MRGGEHMDPITLRTYIDNARYQLEQAVQRRTDYEQQATTLDQEAADLEYQAQQKRNEAQTARDNSTSYYNEEYRAQQDMQYYTTQLVQLEQQAAQALTA